MESNIEFNYFSKLIANQLNTQKSTTYIKGRKMRWERVRFFNQDIAKGLSFGFYFSSWGRNVIASQQETMNYFWISLGT